MSLAFSNDDYEWPWEAKREPKTYIVHDLCQYEDGYGKVISRTEDGKLWWGGSSHPRIGWSAGITVEDIGKEIVVDHNRYETPVKVTVNDNGELVYST